MRSMKNAASVSDSVTDAKPAPPGVTRSRSGNRAPRTSGAQTVQFPHDSTMRPGDLPPGRKPTRTSSFRGGAAESACGAGSSTGFSKPNLSPRAISR